MDVVHDGELFAIYPEGTRTPDGRLHKGRTGVARVALQSGAPVVPVGIVGTYEAAPKHRKVPRPGRVRIRFGSAIDLSQHMGAHNDRIALRAAGEDRWRLRDRPRRARRLRRERCGEPQATDSEVS